MLIKMSNYISSLKVLNEHPDFADGANPPIEGSSTEPDFRIVRQENKRTVLVLDRSGSMDINDRIGKLNQVYKLKY